MPELPEVQTVINILNNSNIINIPIVSVKILKTKLLKNSTPKNFDNFVNNERIIKFERVGKYIKCILTNDKILLIHLRMEGKLFCEKFNYINNEFHNYLRLSIKFNNSYSLNYYDSRIFGTFHIYTSSTLLNSKELNNVGVDALSDKFDAHYLFKITSKSKKYIKTFIMTQNNIAGIGNIYADEILFASKISPLAKANTITFEQCNGIVLSTKKILNEAIKKGGTTFSSFASDNKHIGEYQSKLKVYGRDGHKCYSCGSIIKKIKLNGRGTCYCSHCQK
ncbi:formamidopyrimidine-DNA glycosylase [Bacilli bacterium]|nr:formamidopyrimidine-DNA glycosylase [Bacilli bacterium]GHU51739.1 formamidopyrimidine-DNA glycosylase [Bacilli bacterium]